MNFNNAVDQVLLMIYIYRNPNVETPSIISRFKGITKEKTIYYILDQWTKEGSVKKIQKSKIPAGAPHFEIQASNSSAKKLRELASKFKNARLLKKDEEKGKGEYEKNDLITVGKIEDFFYKLPEYFMEAGIKCSDSQLGDIRKRIEADYNISLSF